MKVLRINQDGTMDDVNISSIKKNVLKNLNKEAIKKGSSDLKELYKWSIEDKEIFCYGWYDGEPGFENKHDLIPNGNSSFLCDENSSEKLLYGDIFILCSNKKDGKFIDFCISDYGAIYELLFDGFDNCDTDEEFSDDNPEEEEEQEESEEETEEDKEFINDDSDLSEEEYTNSEEELDFDENDYSSED